MFATVDSSDIIGMSIFYRAPEGIAIGPSGVLFICDTGNDRIQVI